MATEPKTALAGVMLDTPFTRFLSVVGNCLPWSKRKKVVGREDCEEEPEP